MISATNPGTPLSVALREAPLVAILRGVLPEEVLGLAEALVAVGVRVIEVPLNSPRSLESVERMAGAYGERSGVVVGAGTVLTVDEARRALDAGARILVSPHLDPEIVACARNDRADVLPGVATPTEAFEALTAGATGLKLFPSSHWGVAGVAALGNVLPRQRLVPMVPVGGISSDDAVRWRRAGAAGVGLGSALYRPGDSIERVVERATVFLKAWARGETEA